jgi:hypothetical protein
MKEVCKEEKKERSEREIISEHERLRERMIKKGRVEKNETEV